MTDKRHLLRIEQQGAGRQIISFSDKRGSRVIAVGQTLHKSDHWRTFPDFLHEYAREKLGFEWGDAELKKPQAEQHVIVQWFKQMVEQRANQKPDRNGLINTDLTGASACFTTLAYSLYLLDHNVELQERYLQRLRNSTQMQGAYYELVVANCLIRAGFQLVLEDETDGNSSHCEFTARSRTTGITYWVEAKCRTVQGIMGAGRNFSDGVTQSETDCTTRVIPQLNKALKKETDLPRMIFLELNAPSILSPQGQPAWIDTVYKKLDRHQTSNNGMKSAYVFVTSFPFHWHLGEKAPGPQALAYGLNIPDFAKPGPVSLVTAYKQHKKHADALSVLETVRSYLLIPSTFDGSLPSETFDGEKFGRIGEEVHFINDAGEVRSGKITTAAIDPSGVMVAGVQDTKTGLSFLIRRQISQAQLLDYNRFGSLSYGEKKQPPTETPYGLFCWLVEQNRGMRREEILAFLKDNSLDSETISDEELLLIYAERMTAVILRTTRDA